MALRWQRPTLDTRFHIDLSWWVEQGRDIRVYLADLLCDECAGTLTQLSADQMIDSVNPQTGEVHQVDPLWDSLISCCSHKPEYLSDDIPIVDGVFRILVANGNRALSVRELHERLGKRSPEVILRTLTAGEVYLGLRPYRA
ncbi:MAG: hypothetical protein ACOX2L_04850 [Anaerolineae bacterium]|jgi:hypothetical protein|nr:hypothetical protein [Chloroflexota bacterium]